ncbi:MAG: helix-turn-helix transcriptional regulator [Bacteroidetes bacterium]|nr:helix-turn-helix transcriptional regulator [Bacteroidota bacterium]
MLPKLPISGLPAFQLVETLPMDYHGYVVRGAKRHVAMGDDGRIIIQEFQHDAFFIRFVVAHFTKPMQIAVEMGNALFASLLALKNDCRFTISRKKWSLVRQGQFALFSPAKDDIMAHYEHGKEYQTLEIGWGDSMLEEAVPYFDNLKKHIAHEYRRTHFMERAKPVGHGVLDSALGILRVGFDERYCPLYYEHKVMEYLLLLLIEANKDKRAMPILSMEQETILTEIEEMLRTFPNKKYLIAELSNRMQMNKLKLKSVFRERYGKGIIEYQLAARMDQAKRLLQETDLSTKEVASIVGYRLTTSFITKFREYFGYPPSKISKFK